MEQHHARGVRPDFFTASARYKREADIPWSVIAPALEALGDGAGTSEAA